MTEGALDWQCSQYCVDYSRWVYEPISVTIDNAYVAPQDRQFRDHGYSGLRHKLPVYNGGVYDSKGSIVPACLHHSSAAMRHVPDATVERIEGVERLTGTWLFAGPYFRHFGHLLTEGTGRFYALDQADGPVAGVILLDLQRVGAADGRTTATDIEKQAQETDRNTYLKHILSFFGAPPAVRVVGRPVTVERLIVPSQLMGLLVHGDLIGGHRLYQAHVRERATLAADQTGEKPKRVFVSRNKLPRLEAKFFAEDLLEESLVAAGYAVLYPEEMSLSEQVACYRAATHVILASGSAAHVLALALNGRQAIGLLRRFSSQTDLFNRQLRLMGAASIVDIDALSGWFVPDVSNGTNTHRHQASFIYSLDFGRLSSALLEHGFIEKSLPSPDRRQLDERTSAVERELSSRGGVAYRFQAFEGS